MFSKHLIFLPILFGLLTNLALGQSHSPGANSSVTPHVPAFLRPKVDALGTRFTTPGNERLTIVGSIARPSSGTASFSLIYEIPGKFRYQEGSKIFTYDGHLSSISASTSSADLDLCESIFEDSVDGVLFQVEHAGIARSLMYRARSDDGKSKNYKGPYSDIFQFSMPLGSLPVTPKRLKYFYFDSQSQLLSRVRYLGESTGRVVVETLFQNWKPVSGTFAPTTISRTENGATQFTLTVSSVAVGPSRNDNAFSHQ